MQSQKDPCVKGEIITYLMHQTSMTGSATNPPHYEKAQAGAASNSSWHFSSL